MLAILLAALIAQASALGPAPVPDVRVLSAPSPKRLAEIDVAKVKGAPVAVAWHEDGTLYLQVQDKDHVRHYLITTVPALSVGQVDQAPAWASAYWDWKGAVEAPGDPTLKIDVDQHQDRMRMANMPSGGIGAAGVGPGGAGGGGGNLGALSSLQSKVFTLRFKGHVVGEWTNESPQPGVRIAWAPGGMGLLAFANEKDQLVLADREGRLLPLAGSLQALLPAWSLDGKRLAYLQKTSATTYELMVAEIQAARDKRPE